MRSSSPEVIGRASDIGRRAGSRMLAKTAAGGDPLTEEALYAKLDAMRAEIAGDSTPLEVLLTERIVSLWMLTALLEVLVSASVPEDPVATGTKRSSPLPDPAVADLGGRHSDATSRPSYHYKRLMV